MVLRVDEGPDSQSNFSVVVRVNSASSVSSSGSSGLRAGEEWLRL